MRKLCLMGLVVLILGLTGGVGLTSELKKYFALYGTYLDYDHSGIKDSGYSFTAYGSFGDGKHHGLEAAISQLHINYESGYSDLDQTDYALAYTNTGSLHPNLSLRLGGHYISTDDDLTDEGWIVFTDFTYVIPWRWNAGLEFSYSNYDEVVDLDVFQISPHVGKFFYFGKRSFYLEARGYYIHIDEDKKIGLSMKNYYSFELSGTCTRGPLSVKLSGWVGQQIFAVKNSGFVVYNLAEKYRGGASMEVTYRIQNHILGLTGAWNTYKEGISAQSVNQVIITGFVGFNF